MNSQGCIAKFDVQAVEIRLMDVQESPYMDFSLISLFINMIQELYQREEVLQISQEFSSDQLYSVYKNNQSLVKKWDLSYYQLFLEGLTASDDAIPEKIIRKFLPSVDPYYHKGLLLISEQGNLAQRMLRDGCSLDTYRKLIGCLMENTYYV